MEFDTKLLISINCHLRSLRQTSTSWRVCILFYIVKKNIYINSKYSLQSYVQYLFRYKTNKILP